MIATHVAVETVVAVFQIATLLVQQSTSVVRAATYDRVVLRRRLGSSQVEALQCFQNPHHQVFYEPVYCAASLVSTQVELPQPSHKF